MAKTSSQNQASAPTLPNWLSNSELPERLHHAFVAKQRLAEQGIFFAPIRHHSPACAIHVQRQIAQLKPTHVLIEAPHSFEALLPQLLASDTRPPVAIFAQAKLEAKFLPSPENDDNALANTADSADILEPQPLIQSAYFPFCDYSPEWVAIHSAHQHQANIGFIDMDWAEQCRFKFSQPQATMDTEQTNLMAERYLAYSDYIKAMAQRLHCRDHDELWEHLFEVNVMGDSEHQQDSERFFDEVFTWCALARLDYEPEVLEAEASLHREDVMWQRIQTILQDNPLQKTGVKNSSKTLRKILVVTGGFHTLALIENLTTSADQVPRYRLAKPTKTAPLWQSQAWLIRYSFDRLDALSGYASGMPSPAFYQAMWKQLQDLQATVSQPSTSLDLTALHQAQTVSYINGLCHFLQAQQALELNPFIASKNTATMALGLAQLRGHGRAGRYDMLDAVQTALVKGDMDDGQQFLWQQVHTYLSGQTLGQVADSTLSPALLQTTHQQALALRFKLEDTLPKNRKLDLYRKRLHQQTSRFLHLLAFLDVGFAQRLSGPDFVGGASLELLFEEWRYAWTPAVEARLIELAETGDNLQGIAIAKLKQQQHDLLAQGLGQSAQHTAGLFAQACRIGLVAQFGALLGQVGDYINRDQNLGSLIVTAQQLLSLWHGRTLLNLPADALADTIVQAITQACYLIDSLYDTRDEAIEDNVKCLIALHHLIGQVPRVLGQQPQNPSDLLTTFYQQLDETKMAIPELSKLRGAFITLSYGDNRLTAEQLQQAIGTAFAMGSVPDVAVQFLHGVFLVAPELFVQSSIAVHHLYQLIGTWSQADFLAILPDLRFIFSQLNPRQTERLAQSIAQLSGLAPHDNLIQIHHDISETEMLYASHINHQLEQVLVNDGLLRWLNLG